MSSNYETLAEIVAVASILIKFGFDDILENITLFVEFCNELGIRINGRNLTPFTLSSLSEDITTKEKKLLIEEFISGHEPLYRRLVMVGAS